MVQAGKGFDMPFNLRLMPSLGRFPRLALAAR